MYSYSFEAIGTHWTIEISSKKGKTLQLEIDRIIDGFDKTYSRFREDSFVTLLSKKKGNFTQPADFSPLKEIYQKMYQITEGLFTPLVGELLSDAGYDKSYSFKPKKLKKIPDLSSSVKFNKNSIEVILPKILDFGAAGKGYLVDLIAGFLESKGIKTFTIDAGGDIFHKDSSNKQIRVALEHPEDPTKAIGVTEISNKSICASSGNRRRWNNFHHIINPNTLLSADEVLATWVISDKTLEADALATALFLKPDPTAFKDFKFEYVLLYKDYRALASPGFQGEIFTS